jgi:type IV pilus assembly protein PilY1
MTQHLPFTLKGLASAVALSAAALGAAPALSGVTDISNAPLASASNQSVLPNVMFILDDSGSMDFDTLPDNTENWQMGSERRYIDELYQCKPKGILTTGSYKAGLMPTNCDRVDPPFGAAQFNGLYYDPTVRYRPRLCKNARRHSEANDHAAAGLGGFTQTCVAI